MSYELKRITKDPATSLRILVDDKDPDHPEDGGFGLGGMFDVEPAGTPGDTIVVSAHAARVIMRDPGLRVHFTCTPPLAEPKPDGTGVAVESEALPARGRGGKVATE